MNTRMTIEEFLAALEKTPRGDWRNDRFNIRRDGRFIWPMPAYGQLRVSASAEGVLDVWRPETLARSGAGCLGCV